MQRSLWVDNLKAFGILAVILGHISSPFGAFIYSWHMPLFFIIAGFFIKTASLDSFMDLLKKDFKRLMVPYFIFALLGILADTLKRYLLNRDTLNYAHEFYGVFISMDMHALMNTYAFVLWFLPALFFAKLLYRILVGLLKSFWTSFIVAILLFTGSLFIELPFGLDNACNALVFIMVGDFLFKHKDSQWLYVSILILAGILLFYGIPTLDMASKHYESVPLNILWVVAIVALFVKIFMQLPLASSLITTWGGASMWLFIIHPYTNNVAHIIVEKLHFGSWWLKFLISLLLLQGILFLRHSIARRPHV